MRQRRESSIHRYRSLGVAEPIGEPGARHGRGKALRLRLGPHSHVAAVAVSANAMRPESIGTA